MPRSTSETSAATPAARRRGGPAADTSARLAPTTPGRGGEWRALPRAALLAWLDARPTVADAAWTRVPREPGEARAVFLQRVLGPAKRREAGGAAVVVALGLGAFGPLGALVVVVAALARAAGVS